MVHESDPNPTRNDRLSIEAYIREMEKQDTYGTEVEIDAFAQMLNCVVYIYISFSPDDRPGTGAVKEYQPMYPCNEATV